jgi:hypothetical protein
MNQKKIINYFVDVHVTHRNSIKINKENKMNNLPPYACTFDCDLVSVYIDPYYISAKVDKTYRVLDFKNFSQIAIADGVKYLGDGTKSIVEKIVETWEWIEKTPFGLERKTAFSETLCFYTLKNEYPCSVENFNKMIENCAI